jgi:hypothetical protein
VPHSLYRYDEGYFASHRLEQGRGYWVQAERPGLLRLGCGPGGAAHDRIDAREDGFGQLIVRDADGRELTLQFGSVLPAERDARMFDVPPTAPDGSFDVRFEGDRRLIEASQAYIWLQGDALKEVELDRLPDAGEREYVLTALRDGAEVQSEWLRKGEVMTLDADITGLRLMTADAFDASLPQSFTLEGNFPNPFNPETTIVFGLPEPAEVTVAIYDMLGRRVMTLEPRQLDASPRQEIRIAAGDLASGTYVYQVQAAMGKRMVTENGTMVLLK